MTALTWEPGPESLVLESYMANVCRVHLRVQETSSATVWSWFVDLMAAPGCGEWITVRDGSAESIAQGMEFATAAWRDWAREQAEIAGFAVTERRSDE